MINIIASTALYSARLNIKNEYKNRIIDKIVDLYKSKKTKSPEHWEGNVQSTHEVEGLEETYKEFVEQIAPHIKEYLKIYNVESPFKLHFLDLWFNINKKYDYQEFHIHSESHISGVYYLKVPKNSGDIRFKGINNNNMFPLKNTSSTIYRNSGFTYEPVDDDLILFPSYLEHMVTQSKNDDLRISFAFNVVVE